MVWLIGRRVDERREEEVERRGAKMWVTWGSELVECMDENLGYFDDI